MDSNFWIFLCFGQSNMAGQAPIEEQDLAVSERFLSMATTDGGDGRVLGTWRKAVPPLCRADANLGPADWFGRTLLEVVPNNVRIGIVSVAVEGCPITFFGLYTKNRSIRWFLPMDSRLCEPCIVQPS
jgi:hypothetical protein